MHFQYIVPIETSKWLKGRFSIQFNYAQKWSHLSTNTRSNCWRLLSQKTTNFNSSFKRFLDIKNCYFSPKKTILGKTSKFYENFYVTVENGQRIPIYRTSKYMKISGQFSGVRNFFCKPVWLKVWWRHYRCHWAPGASWVGRWHQSPFRREWQSRRGGRRRCRCRCSRPGLSRPRWLISLHFLFTCLHS